MHVLLIGFMCSGKSRIGKELAPLLGLPFQDLDRVIERRIGPITPFFLREGQEAFRIVEAEVLQELLAGPAAVIATGGGTPCEGDNLRRMKAAGLVVWLDVPMEVLLPRIERTGGDRPLLFKLKGAALRERVDMLLPPRFAFYEQAHIAVQAHGSPPEICRGIMQAMEDRQVR